MRWDNLFDDLESQLEHEITAEEIDLQAEEERLRLARISLRDRLVAIAAGAGEPHIRLVLIGGSTITVRPGTFGKDWLSADVVDESQRHAQCIVPIAAIAGLMLGREEVAQSLTSSGIESASPGISARLGLGFVLRDLCRRRKAVELRLVEGALHGTIDRVGRDHVDLAVHEPGSPRRETAVMHYRVVPFAQILLVRL
jgi:hypothetical protein